MMTDHSDLPVPAASRDKPAVEQTDTSARAKPRRRRHKRKSAATSAAGKAVATATENPQTTAQASDKTKPKTAVRKSSGRKSAKKTAQPSTEAQHEPEAAASEPEFIVLPALAPAPQAAVEAASEATSGAPERDKQDQPDAEDAEPTAVAASQEDEAPAPAPARPGSDFLPEYRSETNGLRELLSSIRPYESEYEPFDTFSQLPSIEDGMHIPYNRPGIPGSPDLPVSPVRYLHYIGKALLGVFLLVFAGLVYSHVVSPTGINWTVVSQETGKLVSWTSARLNGTAAVSELQAEQPKTLTPGEVATIASTPRIETTSATAKVAIPAATELDDLNISAEELERRIREIEDQLPVTASNSPGFHSDSARSGDATTAGKVDEAALRAASIDPEMEQQIFSRAKAYLRQRDIASARMVLNYAASLGSGVSAMALAETYDPAYLQRANLQEVDASVADARKWYKTASGLGMKEADERLHALK